MATNPLSLFAIEPGDDNTSSSPELSKTDLISRQTGALEKLISSLGQRNSNYFSIAGQLLDPGRTGNAGEALGRAASEVGRQQEARDQQAPSIAMLKAQLLNQEYQLGLQQQGMGMLGKIMGTGPKEAVSMLETGELPASLGRMADPRQVVGLMATYKPYGEALKAGIELQQKDVENSLKLLASGIDITKATENLSPDQKADFMSNMGSWASKLGFTLPGTQGAVKQPTTGVVAADLNNGTGIGWNGKTYTQYDSPQQWAKAHDDLANRYLTGEALGKDVKPTVENYVGRWVTGDPLKGATKELSGYVGMLKSELSNAGVTLNKDGTIPNTPEARKALAIGQVKAETSPEKQAPFLRTLGVNVPATEQTTTQQKYAPSSGIRQRLDETPKDFAERKKKIEEPGIKDIAEVASGLNKINRDSLVVSNTDLNELRDISKRPDANKIFAPLQLQGGESYAEAATKVAGDMLNRGINLSVQNLNAHIGVPFEKVYQNLNLTGDQKVVAERARNIISQQVINNIIANKTAAFGGSRVTNYQDQQLSAMNANMNDLPKYIGGWALRRQVDNASLLDTQDEWIKYQREAHKQNKILDPKDFLLSDTYLKDLPGRHASALRRVQEAFK